MNTTIIALTGPARVGKSQNSFMRHAKPSNVRNREIVSLFSGALGLDLGFEGVGFKTKVCVELDSDCVATIRRNRPGIAVLAGDLKKLLVDDPKLLEVRRHLSFPAPFAVVGGPPCQAFSTAGQRQGVKDIRGTLIFDFIRVVEVLQPEFFVMENVRGLMQHVFEEDEGSPLLTSVITARFEALGYKVIWKLVNSADYGVAQTRERVVFIGSRTVSPLELKVTTKRKDRVTLRHAIGDLVDNPGVGAAFTPKLLQYLRFVPEGSNWKALSPEMQKDALGGAYSSSGGKVGFFRRLAWDKPAPTLVTSPVQKATLLCHPDGERPLSVSEYARIQGFPDDWDFQGKMMSHYKQIGNAVPVGLGRAIALAVKRAAKVSTRRRPVRNVNSMVRQSEFQFKAA